MSARGLRDMTPAEMLAGANDLIAQGKDPQRLVAVAVAHRDKWARLEEERAAKEGTPQRLDGRASIYTGETYAEARDRWEAYRVLLVEELHGQHGAA